MNIRVHFLGLNGNRRLRDMVQPQLAALRRMASISSAVVVLKRQWGGGPRFEAHAHLAVPGPDIHAEARDQTLQAAWRKVCRSLEQQIKRRKSKPAERVKSNLQQPISTMRWGRPMVPRVA